MLESVEKERETIRAEVEHTAVRVDRLEREVDYLETQNPAPPCVEVDEKLVENQGSTGKKRKNEKYEKLTGERKSSQFMLAERDDKYASARQLQHIPISPSHEPCVLCLVFLR